MGQPSNILAQPPLVIQLVVAIHSREFHRSSIAASLCSLDAGVAVVVGRLRRSEVVTAAAAVALVGRRRDAVVRQRAVVRRDQGGRVGRRGRRTC